MRERAVSHRERDQDPSRRRATTQKPQSSTAKHASLKAPLAAHFSGLFIETAAAWRKATKRLRRFLLRLAR